MPDIFLSYASQDREVTRRFAEGFEAEGLSVWWDSALRSGEAYDQKIETALRGAKAVVVLWSKTSAESRWVRAEATLADRNKTLAPCLIEPCERPIMFELTHTADLSHWKGDPEDRAWRGFLADVKRLTAAEAAAAPPKTTPVESLPAAPAPKRRRSERPSLAVMPFSNRSGLPEDDALAYGMVEDIISAISLSPGIRVLASSSTMAWAGKPTDLRIVGRDLGVVYVLEGNVRRAGLNLRVSVQLVEAETGAILWTDKFERPLLELAALQEDLVTEMAGRLGVQVQNIEIERALRKPDDLTAYEAVQRALAIFSRINLERVPAAIEEARKAVQLDPDYPMAHAILALSLATHFFWRGGDSPDLKNEALAHVKQALALAPDNAEVRANLAQALNFVDETSEALVHARRGVDLNPNIATTHRSLAVVLLRLNRNDEAIASFEVEQKLAPGHFVFYISCVRLAHAHLQAGRLDKAIASTERALRLNPDFPPAEVLKAGLCAMTAKGEEAADSIRRLRSLEPKAGVDLHLARHLARGNKDAAHPFVTAFRKAWDETPVEATS